MYCYLEFKLSYLKNLKLFSIRDRSQTLVRGAWCKKILARKIFRAPLLDLTIFRGPPFLPRKIGVNPTENHIDSLFRGKISWFFFQGPPFQTSKIFRAPFLHQPPLQVFVNGPCNRAKELYEPIVLWRKGDGF